jgi:hypothetical protein
MDGTLTEAHIDFADMRARTGIPMGDLFTVMEAWTDDARIKAAMDVILEIEAGEGLAGAGGWCAAWLPAWLAGRSAGCQATRT